MTPAFTMPTSSSPRSIPLVLAESQRITEPIGTRENDGDARVCYGGVRDEQLSVSRCSVCWRSAGRVRRSYTSEDVIIDAIWASFDDNTLTRSICVLHSECLLVHASDSGISYETTLPFKARSIWPLQQGVLIEREIGVFETKPNRIAPTMFSVRHPLHDVTPLAVANVSRDVKTPVFACDPFELIVYVDNTLSLLVTYNQALRVHAVWLTELTDYANKQKSSFKLETYQLHAKSSTLAQSNTRFIRPEISMRRIWLQATPVTQTANVFLATTSTGDSMLCMLSSPNTSLNLFTITPDKSILPLATLDAFEAVALDALVPRSATLCGGAKDIVALDSKGRLALYCGERLVCGLQPSVIPIVNGDNIEQEQRLSSHCSMEIVGVCDAVADRFTIVLGDGSKYRVCLPTNLSSCLAQACVDAFSCAVPTLLVYELRIDIAECTQQHEKSSSERKHGALYQDEFDAFSSLLLAMARFSGSQDPLLPQTSLSRSSMSSHVATSAWQRLLNSQFHLHQSSKSSFPFTQMAQSRSPQSQVHLTDTVSHTHRLELIRPFVPSLLRCLHLLYENCKMSTLTKPWLRSLATVLIDASLLVGRFKHAEHYARDFGDLRPDSSVTKPAQHIQRVCKELTPVDMHSCFLACLRHSSANSVEFPSLPNGPSQPFEQMRKLCRFYRVLTTSSRLKRSIGGLEQQLNALDASCDRARNSSSNTTMSMPALQYTQHGCVEPTTAESVVLAMVDEDFTLDQLECVPFGQALPLREAIRTCRYNPPQHWPAAAYVLIGREDLSMLAKYSTSQCAAPMLPPMLRDGNEAERVNDDIDGTLTVADQCSLRFGRDRRIKEVRRLLRSNRQMCLRVPDWHQIADHDVVQVQQTRLLDLAQRQLALSIGRGMLTLASSRPVLTEALPVPPIALRGRAPPNNTSVQLDLSVVNAEFTQWPDFHNGCAAGLRLLSTLSDIHRTWIVYNRPIEPTFEHAGMIMALGLHGHLSALARSDIYWYLSKKHDATTIAILLGMAAAKRKTMDATVSKMLCLHIPALLPPGFVDMEIPVMVQTAAILAVGLLYQGTAHRLMTEVLLAELSGRSHSEISENREGYVLAAGLALGLVTLGRGSSAVGLADLHLEDRLSQCMIGGKDTVTECGEPDELRQMDGARATHNSRIKDSNMINVEVSSAGATLALGLMFLKSNNTSVAARLQVPNTHFLLEYVRSDFILLRVLARNLVMWDNIECTDTFVRSHTPAVIENYINEEHAVDRERYRNLGIDVDIVAIRQAHFNIIAGACLSIGIKFAGSADAAAMILLTARVEQFRTLRVSSGCRPGSGDRVDRTTIESCLGTILLSLALVMAGTGHLNTLRLLRSLRKPFEADAIYGFNMALHMGIGFLFLGGGRYTLNSSLEAVAALICSLYPTFPITTSDNRYHHQAFRHLYVLAVEPRYVETRDVDTGKPCYVPLELLLRSSDGDNLVMPLIAPCLLPELERIINIRVASPRFWTIYLDLENNDMHKHLVRNYGVIFVKRKTGHLLYSQDPLGQLGILSRSFPKGSVSIDSATRARRNREEFVMSFAHDKSLVAFAKHFCVEGVASGDFCTALLYECLTQEKSEIIETHLCIYQILQDPTLVSSSLPFWDLKLVVEYYRSQQNSRSRANCMNTTLIQPELVQSIEVRTNDFFSSDFFVRSLHQFVQSGQFPVATNTDRLPQRSLRILFGAFLTYFEIPERSVILNGFETLCSQIGSACSGSHDIATLVPLLLCAFGEHSPPLPSLLQLAECAQKLV